MNIQELRLGNAVYVKVWDDLNPLFTVTEVGYNVLWVSNSEGDVSAVSTSLVAGIPISKDTVKNLKGLAFEQVNGVFYGEILEGMTIEVDDNVVLLNIDLPDGEFNEVLSNITQIHQLQNLIYDLNGGVMLEYNTNVQ